MMDIGQGKCMEAVEVAKRRVLLASCPVCVYSAPVTMAFVARMMRRGVTARSVQRLAAPSFREYIYIPHI